MAWSSTARRPYCSRIFQTQDELLAWAEKECLRNLAAQGC